MKMITKNSILLLAISLTFANPAGIGAGFKIGPAFPEDTDLGLCLGGHLVFPDAVKSVPGLGFETRLDFWWAGADHYYHPVGNLDNNYFTFQLLGEAKFIFPVKADVKPYLGFGLGFFIVNWSYEYVHWIDHNYVIYRDSDSDVDLGAIMVGGIQLPVSKNSKLLFEFGFSVDGIDTGYLLGGMTFGL